MRPPSLQSNPDMTCYPLTTVVIVIVAARLGHAGTRNPADVPPQRLQMTGWAPSSTSLKNAAYAKLGEVRYMKAATESNIRYLSLRLNVAAILVSGIDDDEGADMTYARGMSP